MQESDFGAHYSDGRAEIPYPCSYCEKRVVAAVARIPFVRGTLLWVRFGDKLFLGCVGCVRGQIFQQAGISMLIGWFSPTAVLMNPIMILYSILCALLVGMNKKKAREFLADHGFPIKAPGDVQRSSYALAMETLVGEAPETNDRAHWSWVDARATGKLLSVQDVNAIEVVARETLLEFDAQEFERYVMSDRLGDPKHIVTAMRRILTPDELVRAQRFLARILDEFSCPKKNAAEFRPLVELLTRNAS
jgi:hypothetical protein